MRLRRPVAALCLGVLLLRALVPGAMHACVTTAHQAGPSATVAEAPVHGEHGGHGEHAGHALANVAGVESAPAAAPSDPTTVPSDCDCASWCCCAPSFVQVGVTPTLSAVVAAVPVARVAPAVSRLEGTRHDRRLPFANAPPAV